MQSASEVSVATGKTVQVVEEDYGEDGKIKKKKTTTITEGSLQLGDNAGEVSFSVWLFDAATKLLGLAPTNDTRGRASPPPDPLPRALRAKQGIGYE